MFCAVYRFNVRPGLEEQLEDSWAKLTDLIYEHEGSLGSRLHRTPDGVYIAYAQWPARETWENASSLPPEADPVRRAMREACESIETVYELEVVDDRLQQTVSAR